MRSLLIAGLVVLYGTGGVGQARAGAPGRKAPTIELYTMGLGEEAVEKFGHAALCVEYPGRSRVRCYNYGATNFDDPIGLGWGFIRGRSRFWVLTSSRDSMLQNYADRDRTVWVQRLPLSDEQALEAAKLLRIGALPENRYYQYHHFYDNCSTRVRDIIDKVSGGALSRDASATLGVSYRDFARQGFAESWWILAVSDFALGRGGDKEPNLYEAMFLPDVLREAVRERMGVEPELVYEREGRPFSREERPVRLVLLFFALLLALPVWLPHLRGRPVRRRHFAAAVVVASLIGIVLWTVSIVSPLFEVRYNECLLLFFPGDLALFFLGAEKRRLYARIRTGVALVATVLSLVGLLVQPLWAMAPLVVLPMLPLSLAEPEPETESEPESLSAERKEPHSESEVEPEAGPRL
jgi:hypothetical protein